MIEIEKLDIDRIKVVCQCGARCEIIGISSGSRLDLSSREIIYSGFVCDDCATQYVDKMNCEKTHL